MKSLYELVLEKKAYPTLPWHYILYNDYNNENGFLPVAHIFKLMSWRDCWNIFQSQHNYESFVNHCNNRDDLERLLDKLRAFLTLGDVSYRLLVCDNHGETLPVLVPVPLRLYKFDFVLKTGNDKASCFPARVCSYDMVKDMDMEFKYRGSDRDAYLSFRGLFGADTDRYSLGIIIATICNFQHKSRNKIVVVDLRENYVICEEYQRDLQFLITKFPSIEAIVLDEYEEWHYDKPCILSSIRNNWGHLNETQMRIFQKYKRWICR